MSGRRLAFALGLALLVVAGCDSRAPTFRNTDVTGADWGKVLALNGHDGKPRTLADFRGKVVVLAFGFTHCPDICPTTLSELKAVKEKLGSDAARLQVLFMTLDPERDTPQVLAKYVPAFDAGFLGLSGDAEATARTAKEFKVFFQKVPGKRPGEYAVDHSAASYVFDTRGRLRLFVRHEQLGTLVDDIRALLKD